MRTVSTGAGSACRSSIDYPPQVEYLLPFKDALEAAGADVVVTARDTGMTIEMLAATGVDYIPVGRSYGRATAGKVVGNLQRTAALLRTLHRSDSPDALIGAGRAAVLAARVLGIPSFALLDYEYVHVAMYRLARSFVLHPDVIDRTIFVERGLAEDRLIAFPDQKRISRWDGPDFDAVKAANFGDASLVKVLVRPPAEESHYFKSESRYATLALLRYLAERLARSSLSSLLATRGRCAISRVCRGRIRPSSSTGRSPLFRC